MPSGTSDVKYVDAYSLPGKPHIAFCDSDDKDILLARHFWLSVHLRPFVESRLVSSDIRQRTIKASLKSQDDYLLRVDHESHALEHLTEFWKKLKNAEYMYQQEFLEGFYKRKKQCKESFLARKSQRINLQEVSGQILQKNRLYSREEEKRWKLEKEIEGPEDVRKQIAEFERKNKIGSVITGLLFHYSRFDERKPIKKVQTKYFEALHKTDDDDEDPCLVIHIFCNEIDIIYVCHSLREIEDLFY
uniref:Uncharacterized protein n=1 Tax=Octopus bimaculoides TaxID=37653 RepID=A0A0L8I0W4_OCTBM|eukprot:XP_014767748.1 PREDICTED: UPF0722 protein C11orf88 homolog [Octopus bimaculoides]